MEKKTNDMIIIAATVLMLLMGIVMFYQNKTLNEYKGIINSIDTTSVVIKHDTIDVSTDTTIYKPVIIKETLIRVDTLYNDDGDAINVKKKKRHIQIPLYKTTIQ